MKTRAFLAFSVRLLYKRRTILLNSVIAVYHSFTLVSSIHSCGLACGSPVAGARRWPAWVSSPQRCGVPVQAPSSCPGVRPDLSGRRCAGLPAAWRGLLICCCTVPEGCFEGLRGCGVTLLSTETLKKRRTGGIYRKCARGWGYAFQYSPSVKSPPGHLYKKRVCCGLLSKNSGSRKSVYSSPASENFAGCKKGFISSWPLACRSAQKAIPSCCCLLLCPSVSFPQTCCFLQRSVALRRCAPVQSGF